MISTVSENPRIEGYALKASIGQDEKKQANS